MSFISLNILNEHFLAENDISSVVIKPNFLTNDLQASWYKVCVSNEKLLCQITSYVRCIKSICLELFRSNTKLLNMSVKSIVGILTRTSLFFDIIGSKSSSSRILFKQFLLRQIILNERLRRPTALCLPEMDVFSTTSSSFFGSQVC